MPEGKEIINSQEYFIEEASKRALKQMEIDKKNTENLDENNNSSVLDNGRDEIITLRNEIKHANEILDEENERLIEIQKLISKLCKNPVFNEEAAVTILEEQK